MITITVIKPAIKAGVIAFLEGRKQRELHRSIDGSWSSLSASAPRIIALAVAGQARAQTAIIGFSQ